MASLPQSSGALTLKGIDADISIHRDEHGVPSIVAESDKDAFFATGFVHAQDRFWQMELNRRTAKGELSQILGRQFVAHDTWVKTLGVQEKAVSSWSALSPQAKASLRAYTQGVNAWLQSEQTLPAEFSVLGITPQKWMETDSLLLIKLFAMMLTANMSEEVNHFVAMQALPKDKFVQLFSSPSDGALVTAKLIDKRRLYALNSIANTYEELKKNTQIGHKYAGSNGWVVSGKHTDTGLPLLANDPHLGLNMPSLWYVIEQKGDVLNSSGMSIPGMPIVIFGKNSHIAWGGTHMMADVQDLFFEQVNPNNPEQYKYGNEWLDIDKAEFQIDVKNDFPAALREPLKPVTVKVRETTHGPIISDTTQAFEQMVSLRWTALDNKDTSYEAFFRLNYAQNWEQFKEALSYHVAPTLNMLYADKNNNIGMQGIGRIPIRSSSNGELPSDGSLLASDWVGYIPYADMPYSFNPKSGLIVNANNRIVDSSYPYYISNSWANPARAERIMELIKDDIHLGKPINIENARMIQSDTVDLASQALIAKMHFLADTPRMLEAQHYLSTWDGNMDGDSVAATLFVFWLKHLKSALILDEFQYYWNAKEANRLLKNLSSNVPMSFLENVLTEGADAQSWCDNPRTEKQESCETQLKESLQSALDELDKLIGDDMSKWHWKNLNETLYHHMAFSEMKVLDSIFERRIPNGGSANSINVSVSSFEEDQGYLQTFGATFRQVVQFSKEQDKHYYMNSTGQSGNPFSAHYDDMIALFNNNQLFNLHEDTEHSGKDRTLILRKE